MAENLQEALFDVIVKSHDNSKPKMVKELMELLSITQDSAYRRVNGTTELRLGEIQILCKTYNISLDSFLGLDQIYTRFILHNDVENVDSSEIIEGFMHLIELFKNLKDLEGAEITYFTMELPLFHLIEVPELLAFKMYYWESIRSVHSDALFSLKSDRENLKAELDMVRQVTGHYNSIKTTEIIYKESFQSVLTQILSYLEQGRFKDPREAIVLFDRLIDLVEHLKYQAKIGKKFSFGDEPPPPGKYDNYEMFYNDSIFSQNTALVKSKKSKMVYLEHNVINFLYTDDENFYNYTEERLNAIMAKSSLISRVSERTRNTYFNKLSASIHRAKEEALRGL